MTAIAQNDAIIDFIPAPQVVRVNMMRFLPEIIQFAPTNRTVAVLTEARGGDGSGGKFHRLLRQFFDLVSIESDIKIYSNHTNITTLSCLELECILCVDAADASQR
jgi:hypothetical protein